MAAELRLEVLGGVRIRVNGAPLSGFVSSKAPALVCYLAVTGQPQFRSTLAGLLWSDLPEDAARRNLRIVLANLRHTLAPHLSITRDTIAFDRAAPYWLDVEQVEAALQPATPVNVERLRAAVALYTGAFLDGFAVRDAPLFDEWASAQRERLHLRVVHALHDLVDQHTTRAEYAAGIDAATRLLQLDPWREETHRQLMRLLALSGQPGAALAQYAACCRVLEAELGAHASGETTRLYEQIRDGELAPQHAAGIIGAAPATHPPRRPTLLSPSTPVLGRDLELAHIAQRLADPACRLLTLTGPGGTGKTRLALHAATVHQAAFADGVVWVPLAAAGSRDQIITAIAEALDVPLGGQRDPHTQLLESLRPHRLLLLLDNLEHLPEARGVIHAILEAAPQVVVLATSRERLNLQAEWLLDVPGLAYPLALRELENGLRDHARVEGYGAVRLFVQRATQVQPRWTLADAPVSAVLRICQLVQGSPLGIELAAPWVRTMSCTDIADEIAQNLDFLTTTMWDVPPRHRSVRAVFDSSWQLLSTEQRAAVAQLAVFRGGFRSDAAHAVAGVHRQHLAALIDTSLLQQDADGRFMVHELLRQFAAEQLDAAGERAVVEERHGSYYLAYLAARGRRLGRGEPKEASSEIQAELDNVRLAWQWAVKHARLAELEPAAYAWWQFCRFGGLEFEGRHSFAVAVDSVRRHLARMPSAGGDAAAVVLAQRLLAMLLAIHAHYLVAYGRDDAMVAEAREAAALGTASGGVEGETFGTFVLGHALQYLEHKHEAGELWQRTIELVRRYQPDHPDSELLHEAHWMALYFLRGTALHVGDVAGSRTYMVQALEICQTLGKRWAELDCLVGLAGTDLYLYDVAAAEAGFAASLELARALRYRWVEMHAQDGLSNVVRLRGDYAGARRLLEQAVNTAIELASPYFEALSLAALIRVHSQLGDQAAATRHLDQLTQLLARVELAKECRLYYYLAAATNAHYAGALEEALAYAEQADQLNQEGGDILFRLVDTALMLGHTRAAMGHWDGAAAAFRQALDAFQRFNNRVLAAEPQAGLAQIALAQGDAAAAQAHIEAVLPVLAEQPHAGYTDPFFIYLTGYRVLNATGDPRAGALVHQGYELLLQDAAGLDEGSRERFLGAVPLHRNLVAAYGELQARADTATRRDVDTERPSALRALRPPLRR